MTETTSYFREQVLRKRPYLSLAMCDAVLSAPLRELTQEDGRVRFWGEVEIAGETRYLRVVTLKDGTTVHNAFLDRNFRPEVR